MNEDLLLGLVIGIIVIYLFIGSYLADSLDIKNIFAWLGFSILWPLPIILIMLIFIFELVEEVVRAILDSVLGDKT